MKSSNRPQDQHGSDTGHIPQEGHLIPAGRGSLKQRSTGCGSWCTVIKSLSLPYLHLCCVHGPPALLWVVPPPSQHRCSICGALMTVLPSKGEAPCCQPAARPEGPDEAAPVGSAPGTGGGSAVMPTRGSGRRRSCGAEQVSFLGRTEPPARSPHLPAAGPR